MNHLIPWSRVLLQNFAVSKPVKKLPTFYGTQTLSAMFTSALPFKVSQSRYRAGGAQRVPGSYGSQIS